MIVGLDIGASYIKGVLWDKKKLRAEVIPTPKNKKDFEKNVSEFIKTLSDEKKIKAIGLSVAGQLSREKIIWSPNLKYLNNYQLPKVLQKEFKVKTLMDNDARCFLRAEGKLGAAKNCKSAIGLTVGTGLGGAILYQGKIIEGAHFTAGEAGHMLMGELEYEKTASGHFAKKHPEAYEILGKNLGDIIANLVLFFDPEYVVLGGGIIHEPMRKPIVLPAMQKQVNKRLQGKPSKAVSIKTGRLGQFAGSIGAALLFDRADTR